MRRTAGLAAAALVAAGLTLANGAAGAVTPSAKARQAEPAGDLARAAIAAVRAHPNATELGGAQGFRATGAVVDRDGTTHVRLDRTYHGLSVVGGDLVVHQGPDGAWQGRSQTLDSVLRLGVQPKVAAGTAKVKALAPSALMRSIKGENVRRPPTLVVDATGADPRLAWEVVSGGRHADGTPSRLVSYVDARSGRLIRAEEQIQTADGSGESLYGGTVPLTTTAVSGGFEMRDGSRGNTYTTDMDNTEDSLWCQIFGAGCSTGTIFTDSDNQWGDGTTADRASAAVDAQYGTNMTWDYYQDVHGRDGIFGDGSGSYNRVHYGQGYVNAFWDGEKMTYGDGDGVDYGPLTSLDVAGHEMTHGVTENSAGLTYSGESGGLNESTSDIFGTMVEFYAGNAEDPGDYLIGEQFDLANHLGFRRMDRPSSDGASYDCYESGIGDADVHYSSGVGNHFFYLLAEGSGPKTIGGVAHDSPTCDGSTVTGIGRDAAAAIWYRALTVYMTSSTDYAQARTASLNAASDLYGNGSTQYDTVAAAWAAVDVG